MDAPAICVDIIAEPENLRKKNLAAHISVDCYFELKVNSCVKHKHLVDDISIGNQKTAVWRRSVRVAGSVRQRLPIHPLLLLSLTLPGTIANSPYLHCELFVFLRESVDVVGTLRVPDCVP